MTSLSTRTIVLLALATLTGCGQFGRRGVENVSPSGAADVHYGLGRSLEADGDLDRAMQAYRESIRRDARRADAPLRLAILLDRQGRFAESALLYEAALKASPGNAEVFCDRGYSLCLQGKDAEAEVALRQAIAKRPDLARAHNNLGLVLARAGRVDDALNEFRKAGCPEAEARLNLAFGLGEAHRLDDAQRQVAIARSLGRGASDPGIAAMDALLVKAESVKTADPAVGRAGWMPPTIPNATSVPTASH